MHQSRASLALPAAAAILALSGTALLAQPAPWGGRDWDRPGWDGERDRPVHGSASAEGRIEVARFRAEGPAADTLTHGSIMVTAMPAGTEEGAALIEGRAEATYQAAVEDQLLHAGYQAVPANAGGQIAEVRIRRVEIVPAEGKRKPLSGEMAVGVSNRGSMMGMALRYDATKPKTALISTQLETRIRDRASGQVLWEGRAAIATREGDARWNESAIAARLSRALFDGFPLRTGEARDKL